MTRLWAGIRDAVDACGRVAMVTVIATRGSSPREAGARLVVRTDGGFTGTIGGGALEWRAIALAQAALADRNTRRATIRRFALGPELGQCCGGEVHLLVEVIGHEARADLEALAGAEAAGPFATRATLGDQGVERRIVDDASAPGTAQFAAGVVSEGFGDDRRPLFLFGAGHVGRALVLALAPLPFSVTWIDPRPDTFPAYVPANVATVGVSDPLIALTGAPAGSFVLAMTHSHALDLAVVHAALADARFAYVGVIGSKTKRARFAKRLAERGIAAERVAQLVCPIGVEGIRGKAPAVIAAATVAELLVRDEALRAAQASITNRAAVGGTRA
jgi:xanthine dehydrogenase accessory factor